MPIDALAYTITRKKPHLHIEKRTWLLRCPCGDYFDGAAPSAKFCPRHSKLKPAERKALLKRRVW